MSDIIKTLSEHYPLDDLLKDNDIEPFVVFNFLYEEGLIDPEDYIEMVGEMN